VVQIVVAGEGDVIGLLEEPQAAAVRAEQQHPERGAEGRRGVALARLSVEPDVVVVSDVFEQQGRLQPDRAGPAHILRRQVGIGRRLVGVRESQLRAGGAQQASQETTQERRPIMAPKGWHCCRRGC